MSLSGTMTIESARQIVLSEDVPQVGKPFALTLAGTLAASVTSAEWTTRDGTLLARCASFSSLVGTVNFNTSALVALVVGRSASAVFPVTVTLYDVAEDVVAQGPSRIENTSDAAVGDPVEADDVVYMRQEDYDADGNGVIDDDALPAATTTGLNTQRDTFTLTAGEVAAAAVTLTRDPNLALFVLAVVGGPEQVRGTDYGATSGSRTVSWSGYGLDGVLEAGDVVVIEYSYTPEA